MARSLLLILLLLSGDCEKTAFMTGREDQTAKKPNEKPPKELSPELRKAHAEVDRIDPGCRLHELEAKRLKVPDDKNSAKTILKVSGLMPNARTNFKPTGYWVTLSLLPPPVIFTEEQAQKVRAELAKVTEAQNEARKLVEQPWGRIPIDWNKDYPQSPAKDRNEAVRYTSQLFHYRALLHAHDRQIEEAMLDIKALMHAGRAVGDEPTTSPMLFRISAFTRAIGTLERVLAQGESPEVSLADLQRLIEDEIGQPVLLRGLRGERGFLEMILQAIADGEYTPEQINAILLWLGVNIENLDKPISVSAEDLQRGRPALLRFWTEAVEIAKQPNEKQRPLFLKLETRRQELLGPVRQAGSPVARNVRAYYRIQAILRNAEVALAVERYRMAKGQWPNRLEQLLPAYLKKVPLDPYDGKPLRYTRLVDGVIVYSVGEDEMDNGGKIERQFDRFAKGTDIGFQLWNVDKRRVPPGD